MVHKGTSTEVHLEKNEGTSLYGINMGKLTGAAGCPGG